MAAREGKVYWELRVISAEGIALVGFVGTSFRCGQQAPRDGDEAVIGGDEASWSLISDGRGFHG